jgi:hypothetical protein
MKSGNAKGFLLVKERVEMDIRLPPRFGLADAGANHIGGKVGLRAGRCMAQVALACTIE